MIDPKEDSLSAFAHWYLNNPQPLRVPFSNPITHQEKISAITLYREDPFQVQLWLCKPNFFIPEHEHPNVDSYEVFLYGMKFTHSGEVVVDEEQYNQENNGVPLLNYQTIRVKPNDKHGGTASDKGGAFLSIQQWKNNTFPKSVSDDWKGKPMGKEHKEQIKNYETND